MTKAGEDSIVENAQLLEDFQLLRKVAGVDFIAKEVKYHNSCRLGYLNEAKSFAKKKAMEQDSALNLNKELRDKALKSTLTFIEVTIRINEEVHRFKSIYENQYILTLRKLDLSPEEIQKDESKHRKRAVLEKLVEHFSGSIKYFKHPHHNIGKVIYKSSMSVETAMANLFDVRQPIVRQPIL